MVTVNLDEGALRRSIRIKQPSRLRPCQKWQAISLPTASNSDCSHEFPKSQSLGAPTDQPFLVPRQ
jgi:hypothetical protein